MQNILSASILSADFTNLQNTLRQCERAGIDWIHVDVMDGHFVPNLTMGPVIVKACRRITALPLDCHLMIEKPETMIKAFAEAGATSITVHAENNPNIHRAIGLIHEQGCKAGVAINPGTDADFIHPLLPFVDMVLVMTVNPGFSGQSFIPEMTKKVARMAELIRREERKIRLEVDGGINPSVVPSLSSAGADTFVSASFIFSHPQGISAGVDALRTGLK